jgi:hypothetical protein
MDTQREEKTLWRSLIGTRQRPGVTFLGNAVGAYTNVVSSADNVEHFRSKVENALDELGLDLTEMEDIQAIARSVENNGLPDEIARMIKTVREIDSVAFGTFYVHNET